MGVLGVKLGFHGECVGHLMFRVCWISVCYKVGGISPEITAKFGRWWLLFFVCCSGDWGLGGSVGSCGVAEQPQANLGFFRTPGGILKSEEQPQDKSLTLEKN